MRSGRNDCTVKTGVRSRVLIRSLRADGDRVAMGDVG